MDGVLRKVAPGEYTITGTAQSGAEGLALGVATSGGGHGRSVSSTDSPFTGNVATRSFESPHGLPVHSLIERYHALISRQPTHIEACLAVLSFFDGMTKLSADVSVTSGKGERGLKDAFSSFGAEKAIGLAAVDLYKYCKSYLLESLGGEAIEGISTGLVLEEIGNLLSWYQTRQESLHLTGERYRLGDENFFGLKISHDVERSNRFGLLLSGGINLDSRGTDELWLSVKFYYQSSVVYESTERPLGTLGERKIGRLIVDRFEQFIDYADFDWPSDVRGKVATLTAVTSVIDRSGKMCFSSRVVEPCRVISSDTSDVAMRVSTDSFGWSDSLLKGHRLDNLTVENAGGIIKVTTDCTVLNYPNRSVVLSVKVFDGYEEQISEEEFSLRCATRIARFYDIQSTFAEKIILEEAKVIEVTLTDEQNKILCTGTVAL